MGSLLRLCRMFNAWGRDETFSGPYRRSRIEHRTIRCFFFSKKRKELIYVTKSYGHLFWAVRIDDCALGIYGVKEGDLVQGQDEVQVAIRVYVVRLDCLGDDRDALGKGPTQQHLFGAALNFAGNAQHDIVLYQPR